MTVFVPLKTRMWIASPEEMFVLARSSGLEKSISHCSGIRELMCRESSSRAREGSEVEIDRSVGV
jgi:hypothetical protein